MPLQNCVEAKLKQKIPSINLFSPWWLIIGLYCNGLYSQLWNTKWREAELEKAITTHSDKLSKKCAELKMATSALLDLQMYHVTFNQKPKCIIDRFSEQAYGEIAKGNNLVSCEIKMSNIIFASWFVDGSPPFRKWIQILEFWGRWLPKLTSSHGYN